MPEITVEPAEARPSTSPRNPSTSPKPGEFVLLTLGHAARLVGVEEEELREAVRAKRLRLTRMVVGGNLTAMVRSTEVEELYPDVSIEAGSGARLRSGSGPDAQAADFADPELSALWPKPEHGGAPGRGRAVEVHELVSRAVQERVSQVSRLERELGYTRARARFGILAAASAGLLVGIALLAFERGRSLGTAERAVGIANEVTHQAQALRAEVGGLREALQEREREHASSLEGLRQRAEGLEAELLDTRRAQRIWALRVRTPAAWQLPNPPLGGPDTAR